MHAWLVPIITMMMEGWKRLERENQVDRRSPMMTPRDAVVTDGAAGNAHGHERPGAVAEKPVADSNETSRMATTA